MTHLIKVGGIGITVAVFGIFFFLFIEILPLFRGAEVEGHGVSTVEVSEESGIVIGADEWGELPFVYEGGDSILYIDLVGDRGEIELPLGLPEGFVASSVRYRSAQGHLILGGEDGRLAVVELGYKTNFSSGRRVVEPSVGKPVLFGGERSGGEGEVVEGVEARLDGGRIVLADLGAGTNRGILPLLEEGEGRKELHAITFTRRRGLGSVGGSGPAELRFEADYDLSDSFRGIPTILRASSVGDNFFLGNEAGEIYYYSVEGSALELRQIFKPFGDLDDPSVRSLDYILGDISFIATSKGGAVRGFSLFRPEGESRRIWGQTKEFRSFDGSGADYFVASPRNKSFLIGSGREARIANLTAEANRWEGQLNFDVLAATLDGKGESAFFLDQEGTLHQYHIHDRHPEASYRAFFGKVWYEGRGRPEHSWQSTGGTDDFESKLSMVPLIIGTLKGTLYALLFAVPIAFLSAVYCAAFVSAKFKRIVKPTMEIMASLPSVVLGFLGGLVLAPLLDGQVPSFLAAILAMPIAAVAMGFVWSKLPVVQRAWLRPGWEWVLLLPVAGLAGYLGWISGPFLEQTFFYVRDANGDKIADFRMWWPQFTGAGYDQRNCLVVGFMMGFAVIPIIFTISEDSLSSVPPGLLAASAALGASRWQTVRNIMIPIAAAGMFSALMIGFGRAVGETMIVLMATGNTPVMEWNIFSGMRTLAANIAVELPEAPVGSTHYRALFLGALILFFMTFAVNTLAEIMRQKLREKFKIV
jgi:phosphate transport system permease protein